MTTATSSPPHQNADPRDLLDQALTTAASVIAGVRADQLTAPTPCAEMDVRTMMSHLVGVADRIAALGNGEDPFAVDDPTATDDGWLDLWIQSAGRASAAWSDDTVLERSMELPWIQGTGAQVLTSYFSELSVHTWDLATATAQQPMWNDQVLAASLAASDFLPAENRRALFEEISASMGLDVVAMPFAEQVLVSADATAIDRLVAWNGRDPRDPIPEQACS